MKLKKIIYLCFTFWLCLPFQLESAGLKQAYEALKIYDYFKAKKIFSKTFKNKQDAYSAYGLAQIYSRTDNPFGNYDSASKYIHLSYNAFIKNAIKKSFSTFVIDSASILSLADSISGKQFQKVKRNNTVEEYEVFLKTNYLGNSKLLQQAVYLRDELEYNHVLQLNRSDSTIAFMLCHPNSTFLSEAVILRDRQIYDETTSAHSVDEYIDFLKRYPKNVMLNTAYEQLFNLYKKESDVRGLADFVRYYPKAPQNLEAWKLLFSLSVKAFSFNELKKFVEEYPEFPLKNSILKELELNKQTLYPYQQGELTGFIDNKGNMVFEPVYDAATDFYEGLSVVTKNDSVFFINKENQIAFNRIFEEAFVFKYGIAPVKYDGRWYFISRQGQTVAGPYGEINELSDGAYIIKLNDKYGAVDQYAQLIIEPKFNKLGDFKNGLAYYMEDGFYGFVSKNATVHKPEFDWISDFNDERIAIIRINNKYGLVNSFGKRILPANYDQIIKTNSAYFIVVQGNSYGFFNSAGCFISAVVYEYSKERLQEYYTDGNWFKLIKKGEQALMDINGSIRINYGTYDEINFMSCGLLRIKQKKKYGYIDKKGNLIIPAKFAEADDFSDSAAVVLLKQKYRLITTTGKETYASVSKPVKISKQYYLAEGESKMIINHWGEIVLKEVEAIQKLNSKLLAVSLSNGEIKLLTD